MFRQNPNILDIAVAGPRRRPAQRALALGPVERAAHPGVGQQQRLEPRVDRQRGQVLGQRLGCPRSRAGRTIWGWWWSSASQLATARRSAILRPAGAPQRPLDATRVGPAAQLSTPTARSP